MSYQPGKMGVAEGLALVFMVTFVPIFMTMPAVSVNAADTLGWLATLVHGIVSMLAFAILCYVFTHVEGDLYEVCEILLGRMGAWIISLYFCVAFFANYVVILRQFAENTLLTALPQADFAVIISAYAIAAGILVYLGIEGMSRASFLILPFAVSALLAVLLLLVPFYNWYHLFPLQGNGIMKTLTYGASVAGLNIGVFGLAVIAKSFQNRKTVKDCSLYGLGLSTGLRGFSVFVYILTFGLPVAKEKMLPFFEMARLVYLSRYLQRIEALFILLWVIIGVLGAAFSLYFGLFLITRVFRLPTFRPLIPSISIMLAMLSMIPTDVAEVAMIYSYLSQTYFNLGIYAVPLVLLLALLFKKRKGAAPCVDAS